MWQKFDYIILGLICVSSVFLAIESPLDDPDSTKSKILFNIDIAMTCIFSLEVVLKIIAMGFIFNG